MKATGMLAAQTEGVLEHGEEGVAAKLRDLFQPGGKIIFLGFSLMLVWEACFYELAGQTCGGGFDYVPYRASEALFALAVALLTSFGVRSASVSRILALASALSLFAGPAMLVPHEACQTAGIVLGGVGACAAQLLWLHTYSGIGLWPGLAYLLLSFAVSELIESVASLALPVALVGCVVLPALTPVLVRRARTERSLGQWVPGEAAIRPCAREVFPLLGILLFGLVFGVVQGAFAQPYANSGIKAWATACKLVAFLILFAVLAISRRGVVRIQMLAAGALGLVVVMLFLLSIFGGDSEILRLCLSVTRKTVALLFLALLVLVASGSAMSPQAILGLGIGFHSCGSAVGSALSGTLAPSLASSSFLMGLVIVALVASALLLGVKVEAVGDAVQVAALPAQNGEADNLEARCQEVGRACGLTPREMEVVGLYCQGLSRTEIATRLCITENTARAHIKRAYTKLDIHSKEELFARLGFERRLS